MKHGGQKLEKLVADQIKLSTHLSQSSDIHARTKHKKKEAESMVSLIRPIH